MSDFTPGPWTVNGVGGTFSCIAKLRPHGAQVNANRPIASEEEIPNARLIAAAPELLECLKDAARDFSIMRMGSRMEKWDAAIAKAEGK